ncbi:MAG: Ig-like domain-containing protein, partial [Oscillospiraceae bacterium]|nr:Ig-like domain-containing protein [Oscillospiraceae bacterium]
FPMWKDSAWPFGAGDYKLTYTEYANICKKIFDNFAQAQFIQNEILDESGFNLLLNYDKAYFVIGTGNKTITSVKFQYSNSDVDERLYESDLSYDNLGDGTVPYYSASVCDKIKYLDENRWFEINAEHNGMTSKNRVIRWVTEVLKYGVSAEKDDPLAKREYTTIRIACPVDVTVTNGEETLSSANGSLSTGASFGRLDIIGENDEIKMLCIDTSDEYDITINGTDSGTMDYAIRFFDEDGNQLDERIFEKVPVTENTVIKTNSAPEENTLLQVDTDGDGASDEIWSAGKGDWVTADENARIPIESIGFEKNTVKINAGEQFNLAAKVYPENANDGVGFIYSSSEEAVAKVDENGTVSAIAAGTATIKAIATNGMEAEIEVEVTEVTAKDFAGKKVSILSHSASTYAGVSNNTAVNSTIGKNDVYYTEGKHGVYLKDTWWQQTIDALDMELLVNNSWSGSCVFQPRKGAASVTYGDRAINLHNDHTGEEPDIIFVYIGGNDFAYYKDTYGKAADIDYSALIKDNGDGTFTYAAPTTTCEAYAITLHKAHNRYPNAEIYCMTSTARRETDYTGDNYPDAGQPTEYSAELKKVAGYFGFPVIDLENAIPKEVELFDKYMGDKRAHPNALGMDQITNEVLSVMLGKEAEIRHVTAEKGAVKEQAVLLGESYTAKAEVPESYTVSVFMEGKDVTEEVYSNGIISIEKITGDVEVKAVREAMNFRWELNNDVFDSVSGNDFSENKLTLLEGNIKDGIFSGVKYSLADKINLYHNKPWVMEWACTGNWDAALFTESSTSGVKDSDFIFRSSTDHELLAIGAYDGKQYSNYGVSTKELDLDMTKRHVYRLENRVSDNGNMVWLYIDGVEIGPMNNHYIGSKQNTGNTSDWVSGRDFTFGYMGTVVRAINYCSLEYVEVWENGKPESVYKIGDINRDGKVNTIDANYARRYAAGLLTLDEAQKLAGDVNLDGEVNVMDSAIIRRYVVKYVTELPYKIS